MMRSAPIPKIEPRTTKDITKLLEHIAETLDNILKVLGEPRG